MHPSAAASRTTRQAQVGCANALEASRATQTAATRYAQIIHSSYPFRGQNNMRLIRRRNRGQRTEDRGWRMEDGGPRRAGGGGAAGWQNDEGRMINEEKGYGRTRKKPGPGLRPGAGKLNRSKQREQSFRRLPSVSVISVSSCSTFFPFVVRCTEIPEFWSP